MVISTDRAHVSVPIDIVPLKSQLQQVHTISAKLLKLAKLLGDNTVGGLYVKSLSHTADLNYQLLNNKFETIVYYYTRKQDYGASKVFDGLEKRRKTVDEIIPNKVFNPLKQPNLSMNSVRFNDRRSLNPPDTSTKTEPEIVQPESENNSTEEAESNQNVSDADPDLDKTESEEDESETEGPIIVTPNTTTSQPTPFDWSQLYGENVEQNSIDNNPEAQDDPEDFQSPFDQEFLDDPESPPTNDERKKRSVSLPEANNNVLKRSKRFLTGLVISLLTSIGVGSIFGAVSASQISTLKTGVDELGSRQNLIIHQLEKGSKEIMTNRNMIDGLESLTIKLAKFTTTQHFEANGMLLYVRSSGLSTGPMPKAVCMRFLFQITKQPNTPVGLILKEKIMIRL